MAQVGLWLIFFHLHFIQIGGLPDFYHFKLVGPEEANIKPDVPYATSLEADESVGLPNL